MAQKNSGPIGLAGGIRTDIDPMFIETEEACNGSNFVHRNGVLAFRPCLVEYNSFSSNGLTRTNLYNSSKEIKFENADKKLFFCSGLKIYSYNGASWVDHSTAAIGTGGDGFPWDICYGVDDSSIGGFGGTGTAFFTNGQNEVIYINPTNSASTFKLTVPNAPFVYSGPSNLKAKFCTVFDGALFLAHTNETGIKTTRLRRSKTNNFLEFNTANGARVYDLADTSGAIVGIWKLGKVLYIPKEDTIVCGQNSSGTMIFPLYLDVGVLSGRSFQLLNENIGIFLGRDNIYALTGPTNPTPIGDQIVRDIIKDVNGLNYSALERIVSHFDFLNKIYRIFIPIGNNTTATKCYAYDYTYKRWWIEEYEYGITCAANTTIGVTVTIGSLVGTIGSYSSVTIGSWSQTEGKYQAIVGTNYTTNDNRLATYGEGVVDLHLNGNILQAYIEGKDNRLCSGECDLDGVILYYSSKYSFSVEVGVSVDQGGSYDATNTFTVPPSDGGWIKLRFGIHGLFHRIRIRIIPTTLPPVIKAGELVYNERGAVR